MVAVEAAAAGLVQQVREAIAEVVAGWSRRLAGKPLIELRAVKIDKDGRDATELFHLGDICAALTRSSRMVCSTRKSFIRP